MGRGGYHGGRSGGGRIKVQSFDQFAASRNNFQFAGDVATHRLPNSNPTMRRRIMKRELHNIQSNANTRNTLQAEYDRQVASGKVRPPTRDEALIDRARGNPENASVQAARRLLTKRGIKF